MRKPALCICENKDADQLRGNREADQRLCFRYTDSTISLLPKYEISSLQPSSVAVQPGLCGALSETPKTGFLTTRLKWMIYGETFRTTTRHSTSCNITNKISKLDSCKSSENVLEMRVGQTNFFSNNQSTSVTLNELSMKAKDIIIFF